MTLLEIAHYLRTSKLSSEMIRVLAKISQRALWRVNAFFDPPFS